MALIAAARQVGAVGDDAQRQAARTVLEEAARRIYSILAAGPWTPTAGSPTEPETEAVASVPAGDAEDGATTDTATES
jgi:hypothetical protein